MMVVGEVSDISMLSLEHQYPDQYRYQHDEGEEQQLQQHQLQDQQQQHYSLERIVEAATVLLRARRGGLSNNHFCHPTLDDYEPYVPRCRTSAEQDDAELWYWHGSSTSSRRMQDAVMEHGWQFYATNVGGALLCIAAVALIAGLFLGYLTLDAFDLRIVERASLNLDEREYARTILPIVVERHRVLVTLLILNGLAYETCE